MTAAQEDEVEKATRKKIWARHYVSDVYQSVFLCKRDEGLHRNEVAQELRRKMSKKEVDDALDYLSGKGHIYSTIDEDHFKAIGVAMLPVYLEICQDFRPFSSSANEEMKREMATLRFLLAIVLAVVSVLLLLVLWRTHNLGSICDAGRFTVADGT